MGGKRAAAAQELALEQVEPLIHEIRGEKVILGSDLARLYGVTTKRLNEQVKRNQERFPGDFMLAAKGTNGLRSQIATLKRGQNIKYRPYAFTEHGAIMAANVLNSLRTVQMSLFVVRAFLKMRALLGDKRELAKQLAALEKELKQRLDIHEAAIVTILQRVHGHHRPAGFATRAGKTEDRIQTMTPHVPKEERGNAEFVLFPLPHSAFRLRTSTCFASHGMAGFVLARFWF